MKAVELNTVEEFEVHAAIDQLTGHDFDFFTEDCRACGMNEATWKAYGYPTCRLAPGLPADSKTPTPSK